MFDFTQITLVIGKCNKNTHAIDMLGTGFLISNEGKVVTARHVVGNETNDLCVLLPHIPNINVYQDVTDLSCRPATAIIEDINPITDLCILKTDLGFNGNLPPLESLDNIPVGEKIGMFGFPHCVMGRRVLTYQETEIGERRKRIKLQFVIINDFYNSFQPLFFYTIKKFYSLLMTSILLNQFHLRKLYLLKFPFFLKIKHLLF